LLSPHANKRAVERYWLGFTIVWGCVNGLVMLTGLAEAWGDVELMLLGVGLAAGAVVPPVLRARGTDRARPWWRRTAFKMAVAVVGFSFGMNYLNTPFFFDVLHMHYGFGVTITIDRNPVFLYFMTVPYFATYSVLASAGARGVRRWVVERPRWLFWIAASPVVIAIAFLESALNANPFMKSLFCFDDLGFMLWFGSIAYGVALLFAMPVWLTLDEDEQRPWGIGAVVLGVALALGAMVPTYSVLRHAVAPHFTTVVDDAPGLRDYDGSCLERPGR
jgi:hypothetical protein